jgi:adenosine deaminase
LLDAGVKVSLGSDDPPLFGTTITEEYRRCAETFDWTPAQVLAMARAAVEHSFMAPARKAELIAEQERVFAELELSDDP